MKRLLYAAVLVASLASIQTIGAAPALDAMQPQAAPQVEAMAAGSVSQMLDAAQQDSDVKNRLAELALLGWRADFLGATGDVAQLTETDDPLLGNARAMARVYVPVTNIADPSLKVSLIFGTTDSGQSFVAIGPHADDQTGKSLAAIAAAMGSKIGNDAGQLIEGAAANDRQKISYPHYWSCKYVNKIGTSVACFSLWGNPFGAYYGYLVRYGYAKSSSQYFGWWASWKGCGVACPFVVTSTSGRGLICGQVPNPGSCTGF